MLYGATPAALVLKGCHRPEPGRTYVVFAARSAFTCMDDDLPEHPSEVQDDVIIPCARVPSVTPRPEARLGGTWDHSPPAPEGVRSLPHTETFVTLRKHAGETAVRNRAAKVLV